MQRVIKGAAIGALRVRSRAAAGSARLCKLERLFLMNILIRTSSSISGFLLAALTLILSVGNLRADETCSSPYLARIEGQEEFVYVWTLGQEGVGDGSDKLVTLDVKPGSPNYGKVVNSYSVGGRNEAHHGGFTVDRRQLWLAGLESSRIFVFDVHTDPAKPQLLKTIGDFAAAT